MSPSCYPSPSTLTDTDSTLAKVPQLGYTRQKCLGHPEGWLQTLRVDAPDLGESARIIHRLQSLPF